MGQARRRGADDSSTPRSKAVRSRGTIQAFPYDHVKARWYRAAYWAVQPARKGKDTKTSAWWTRRSAMAATATGSPKNSAQAEKFLLGVGPRPYLGRRRGIRHSWPGERVEKSQWTPSTSTTSRPSPVPAWILRLSTTSPGAPLTK